MTAIASDNVGVTKLEIYVNGVLKASNTNSTSLSYSWVTTTGYPDATYPIYSKAYDHGGNVTTSTTVQAHVNNTGPDTTPPSTSISPPPIDGATVSGTITMTALASDNVGVTKVEFYVDATSPTSPLLCTDNTQPYNCTWDTTLPAYAPGTHHIYSKAYDAAGNVGTSTIITVTTDNTPDTQAPTTSITAPADGATVSGTVSVTAIASDNVGVTKLEIYINGVLKTSNTNATSLSYSWVTTAGYPAGIYPIYSKAYDGTNVTTSTTVQAHVNNTGDTTPPATSIISPTGGPVSGTITVSVNATDNAGVTNVELYLDGATPIGSTTIGGPTYSITWDTTTSSDGPHTLTSKAYDGGWNITTSSPPVSVSVSNGTSYPFWYLSFRDENDRLATQYTVTGGKTRTMDYFYLGNTLVASRDSGGNHFYQYTDHLGSVRAIVGSDNSFGSFAYDPWGAPLQSQTSVIPVKYAGMERDYDTGKDYDHARFRSTYMGRFLGVDKVGGHPTNPQSWNRYAYAGNNPVRMLDPNGREKITFEIRTMIKAPTVAAPYPGIPFERHYAGDGSRGTYRTLSRFTIETDPAKSGRPVLPGQARDTGVTHQVDANGNPTGNSGKASDKGLVAFGSRDASGNASVTATGSATNPLQAAPSIDYSYSITPSQDGKSFGFSGTFDGFPSTSVTATNESGQDNRRL